MLKASILLAVIAGTTANRALCATHDSAVPNTAVAFSIAMPPGTRLAIGGNDYSDRSEIVYPLGNGSPARSASTRRLPTGVGRRKSCASAVDGEFPLVFAPFRAAPRLCLKSGIQRTESLPLP